jgi:lyso-ornithine lipid O-acyltransferase
MTAARRFCHTDRVGHRHAEAGQPGEARLQAVRAIGLGLIILVFVLAALPLATAGGSGSRAARVLGQLFCRTVLAIIGVRLRIIGEPMTRAAGRLVVANHVSWLDPLVFGAVEPLCPLAKREVASWPVISTFARLQEAVFVDRKRRRDILRVNRAMAERLRRGRSVLFFPEGTTHDGVRRGRFLTSHFACLTANPPQGPSLPDAIVQPVAIAYDDPAAAWVGDATLLPHLWAILGRPGPGCTLIYGAPRRVRRGCDRKRLGACLAADVEALLEDGDEHVAGGRSGCNRQPWQQRR